ncbi:hypothetical protein [Hoeflea halophila]|nr:hypothetical protein [Hoeflea halophila]
MTTNQVVVTSGWWAVLITDYSIKPIFIARATASIVVLANSFLRAEAR